MIIGMLRGRECGEGSIRHGIHILLLAGALILLFSVLAADDSDAIGGACGTGTTWEFEIETLTISGTGPMDDIGPADDDAPWSEYRNNIRAVVISEGVTSVGDNSFRGYDKILEIRIADSVLELGESSFADCTGAVALYIPISLNPITSTSNPAFGGCTNIQRVKFSYGTGSAPDYTRDDSVTSCIYTPWYLSRGGLSEISIPEDVTHIGNNMFFGCSKVVVLVIPETVTSIGQGAFTNCSGIMNLTLPVSTDAVGSNDNPAFKGCSSIRRVTFTKGTGEWFPYDTGTVSTASHIHFTPWYFSKDTVEDAIFDSGVSTIGDCAFQGYDRLETVELPNSLTSIGNYAFSECRSIQTLTIPDGVTSLGESAFRNCTVISDLSLPISLNAVAYNANPAFEGCVNIERMTFTVGSGMWHVYQESSSLSGHDCYLYTPWYLSKSSITDITLEYGVVSVSAWQFNTFTALRNVILPESVTLIGQNAFSECTSLASIQLPNYLTEIGSYSFDGCSSLASVNFPDTLHSIGDFAFRGCTALTTITLPDGLTSVGQNAFRECSITEIDIPDTLTNVGDNAFSGCPLATVDTGDGLTALTPFKFTDSLESIRLGLSITTIRSNEFSGCSKLTTMSIPMNVSSIGYNAFGGCTSLASIHVDDSNPNYASEEGVLFDKGKTKLICYPYAKQNTSYVMPETLTEFTDDALSSGYLIDVTIGANMSGGFTVSLKNGKISITDRDASILSGRSHRIVLDRNNPEDPATVKKLAGVFDVYNFILEDADMLEDGATITIKIDSRSRSRSVYQLFADGNYSMISSDNDYESDGTTYTFKLSQSSYFSIMSQNEGMAFQVTIFVVMVIGGTIAGGYYIYRLRRTPDGQ